MDINKLLQGMDCACGKKHTCDIDFVYIEPNAAARLTELCADRKGVLLVADENTWAAAGAAAEAALKGKIAGICLFSGKEVLVPNEAAIAAVEVKMEGVDLLLAIGSGVIQDLCKYVSHVSKVPYMVLATAPSMDGYASDGAAMILEGMKVTVKAGLPRAILADPAVLAAAPMDMIRAGYGDIIGKFSALNDWKLSRCVTDEYFCDFIYDLTFRQIQRNLELADGLQNRDEEAVKALMEALVVIGILMSFAGSSRPASGSEHHLSHFFEITGIVDRTPYLAHGVDVACSTVITAGLRRKLLAGPFPKERFRLSPEAYRERMEGIYKQVAEGCMALQEKVGNYAADRIALYHEKEQEIRSILAEMPAPEEVEALLQKVGLSLDAFYELYGKQKIEDAVLYSKDLKDRYTVLWLYYDLFGNEAAV